MGTIIKEMDTDAPEFTRFVLHVPKHKVELFLWTLQREGLQWQAEPAAQHSAAYEALEASNRRERFFLAALTGFLIGYGADVGDDEIALIVNGANSVSLCALSLRDWSKP